MFQAEILPFVSDKYSDAIFITGRQSIVKKDPDFNELIVLISTDRVSDSNSLIDSFSFQFNLPEKRITIFPFDFSSDNFLKSIRQGIFNRLVSSIIINFSMLTELTQFHQFLNALSFFPPRSLGYFIQKREDQYICQYISPPIPYNLSPDLRVLYEFLMKEGRVQTIKDIRERFRTKSYHYIQRNLKRLADLGLLFTKSGKYNQKQYIVVNQYKEHLYRDY